LNYRNSKGRSRKNCWEWNCEYWGEH